MTSRRRNPTNLIWSIPGRLRLHHRARLLVAIPPYSSGQFPLYPPSRGRLQDNPPDLVAIPPYFIWSIPTQSNTAISRSRATSRNPTVLIWSIHPGRVRASRRPPTLPPEVATHRTHLVISHVELLRVVHERDAASQSHRTNLVNSHPASGRT
jgi:hypothetical protein